MPWCAPAACWRCPNSHRPAYTRPRLQSEHTLDGRHAHVELQIHHKGFDAHGDERLAVVSLLIEQAPLGVQTANLLGFFGLRPGARLPDAADHRLRVGAVRLEHVAAAALSGAYYRYEGSLTSPPCTRMVDWFVLRAPVLEDATIVDAFRAAIEPVALPARGNNRPTQPLSGRLVELVLPSDFGRSVHADHVNKP